jgi:hypothetical protein
VGGGEEKEEEEEKLNDFKTNRTRDLLACVAVPQPTALPQGESQKLLVASHTEARTKRQVTSSTLAIAASVFRAKQSVELSLPAAVLLRVLFNTEDGSDALLRNACECHTPLK